MFVDVPDPVWYTSTGKASSSSPASTRAGRGGDRLGDPLVDARDAERGVHARRVALDRAQRPGHPHVERTAGDREVGERQLGLRAPRLVHDLTLMTPESGAPDDARRTFGVGMAPPVTVNGEVSWPAYDAVLFDLDGVLTPTAELHQQAWTEMFEQFLDEHVGPRPCPVHRGRLPRLRRRQAALRRGALVPRVAWHPPARGRPGRAARQRVDLGPRVTARTRVFQELLRTQGIAPYPGSMRLLDHLAGLGIPAAVVSSSRNAREVLEAAGLAERFAVVADGVLAAERGLPGKPAPDLFLAAAEELGVPPGSRRSSSRTRCRASPPGGPAGSGSSSGSIAGPGGRRSPPTAPTSSSTTSPSSCPTERRPTDEAPAPRPPAAAPFPARPVAARRAGVRRERHRA